MNVMLKFVLFAMGLNIAYALSTPVYDCDYENPSLATFSLMNPGTCEMPRYDKIRSNLRQGRFLEINDNFLNTYLIKCKVKVRRTLIHCRNSSSGIDAVKNNTVEYIHAVNYDSCKDMHENGRFIFPMGTKQTIINIVNKRKQEHVLFAGYNDNNKCKGINYSDPYGTWQNVVVTCTLKISLEKYSAAISFEKNKIYLKSNTVCSLFNENCIDLYDNAQVFWRVTQIEMTNYTTMYETMNIQEIKEKDEHFSTIHVVFYKGIALTFITKYYGNFSRFSLFRTQHSRLFLLLWTQYSNYNEDIVNIGTTDFEFEPNKMKELSIKKVYTSTDLKFEHYMNQKTFYIDNWDMQHNWISLYINAVEFYCNLDYQKLIITSPYRNDLFAYNFMKVPGYTAIFAGDVVHIIKCILIEVELTENMDECFLEPQVQLRNKTYYVMPFTRILNLHGNRIPCKTTTSSYDFVSSSPSSHLTLSERNNYVTKKTMLDVENKIKILTKNVTIFKKILEDMMWLDNPIFQSNFITVDFSGLFFVCVIVYVIQIIVHIIIRGFTLHSVFGWSINLLGAIWSSTSLFLCSRKTLSKKITTASGSLNLEMNTNVTIE